MSINEKMIDGGMFSPVWEDMKKVCRRIVDILADFESRDVR